MGQRMKLEVAYHGQSFHGWQKQRGQRTVQGELAKALAAHFRGRRVSITGAGRTDAGVHAAGQVAHLDPPLSIPPEALVRVLNSRLPPQIRVLSGRFVDAAFHACKSALGKRYSYRARWSEPRLPWVDPRSAVVKKVSDTAGFSAALEMFEGRHDWASFTVIDPGTETTIRTLFRVQIRQRQEGIDLDFIGEGFLRYQVRRMVGALLEVGTGQRDLDDLKNLIDDPQPGARIRTAPAHGLCLEHVYYRRCPAVTDGQS